MNAIAFAKKLISLFLCLALLSWSFPAYAATNSRLESQVLEIIREHPEVVLQSIQAYQQQEQQKLQQAQQSFLQKLKDDPKKAIAQSPTVGAEKPKLLLVEFSDFQCPFCAEAHKTLKDLMAKHEGEILLTYKHFPLIDIHPEALPAAKASWAAAQQSKFWEYQDALFSQQDKLGEELYQETAKKLELDLDKFESDRTSEKAAQAIKDDTALAEGLGLNGTPFFIISNGDFAGAVQLADLEKVITQINEPSSPKIE